MRGSHECPFWVAHRLPYCAANEPADHDALRCPHQHSGSAAVAQAHDIFSHVASN